MIDRKSFGSRQYACSGLIFYVMVGLIHPVGPASNQERCLPNTRAAPAGTAVHLGQFAGMALVRQRPLMSVP